MGCLFSFFRRGTFHPADLNPTLKKKRREGDSKSEVSEANVEKIPKTSSESESDSEIAAATKIQASYRGYKTRKSLKELAKEEKQKEDEEIAAEILTPLKSQEESVEENIIEELTSLKAPLFKPEVNIEENALEILTPLNSKESVEEEDASEQELTPKTPLNPGESIEEEEEESKEELTPKVALQQSKDSIEEEAAVKIQSGVRGFLTRRRLQKSPTPSKKSAVTSQESSESTEISKPVPVVSSGELEHDLAVERILKQYAQAPSIVQSSPTPSVSSEEEEKSTGVEEIVEVSTKELQAQLSDEKEHATTGIPTEILEAVIAPSTDSEEVAAELGDATEKADDNRPAAVQAQQFEEDKPKVSFESPVEPIHEVKASGLAPAPEAETVEKSEDIVNEILAEAESTVESLVNKTTVPFDKDDTESESGTSHNEVIIEAEIHQRRPTSAVNESDDERPESGKSEKGSIPVVAGGERITEPVALRNKSQPDEGGAVVRRSKRNTSNVQTKYRSGFVEVEPEPETMNKKAPASLDHINEADLDAEIETEVLNNAAAKIQAGFRGYKARRSLNQAKASATKIQAGFRGYKARKKVEQEKKAAVKIQATVRGFLARRRIAKAKLANQTKRRKSSTGGLKLQRRRSSTITAAAIRIQSAYRGYAVRKNFKEMRPDSTPSPTDDIRIENVDPNFI